LVLVVVVIFVVPDIEMRAIRRRHDPELDLAARVVEEDVDGEAELASRPSRTSGESFPASSRPSPNGTRVWTSCDRGGVRDAHTYPTYARRSEPNDCTSTTTT
jgi:hypothetical protein